MPDLKINTNNTRTSTCYVRFPQKSVNFSQSFFPYFSKLRSSLDKSIKNQNDLSLFKDSLKLLYKPVKHRHYKYGTKVGNRFLAHLRVGRSFLNSHRFVTGLSETDKCKNCNENKVENISHFTLLCPAFSSSRLTLFKKISSLVPNFPQLSQKDKISLLLNGINLNSGISDCRNVPIMFAMQNFILSTKRFEKPS